MINQLFSIPPFQQEQHELSDIIGGSNSNNNNYPRINVDRFALEEMCKLSERVKQLEKELKARTQSYNSQ